MSQTDKTPQTWIKATAIYAEISELSTTDALKHVASLKDIDAEVKGAVIILINSSPQAADFFQQEISSHFNFNRNSYQEFQVGELLDEYELLEQLGRGGMSQVFKAKRINTEQQSLVAIKIFNPKDNTTLLLERFIQEQKILAGLSHPNIVKMLHSGTSKDNVAYLVMELVENALPINIYCDQHECDLKQKIECLAKCAQVLAYSHANLIIHRDLKPANILVDQNNELKIVDFGIAKHINTDATTEQTTIMALTPSYAAPEQINSQPISVQSDVFSLAMVALNLITGKKPLPKDRVIKSCATDEEFLYKTFKSIKLSKDLKNILCTASADKPEERYSSMQSFADDLNNWLHDEPVKVTSQSLYYRIKKFAMRRSALFATMVSFFFFLIISSVVSYKQYQQISIEAGKAAIVKDFILDTFRKTHPDVTMGVEVSAKDLLRSSYTKLTKQNDLDENIRFELLQTMGIAYGAIGDKDKAIELLQQSLQIQANDSHSLSHLIVQSYDFVNSKSLQQLFNKAQQISYKSHSDEARVLRIKAKVLAKKSDFPQAMITLNKAIELNQLDHNKIDEILAKRLLAELYFLQSQPQQSIKLLKQTLLQADDEIPITLIVQLKSDLGILYNDVGDYSAALEIFKTSVQQIRKILGNNVVELSKTLYHLAGTYRYLGMMDKALAAANESYQINLTLFGENNIQTAYSLDTLATMSYQVDDIEQAIDYLQKAIAIYENKQPKDYIDTLQLKTNLAMYLNITNQPKAALAIIENVYNLQKQKLGKLHSSTIYAQQIYARTLSQLGQLQVAISLAENALANAQQTFGLKNPRTGVAYFSLAKIYYLNKQFNKSLAIFLKIYTQETIPTHIPNYPQLLQYLAEIYNKLDKLDKAQEFYNLSIDAHIKVYSESHPKTQKIMQQLAQLQK